MEGAERNGVKAWDDMDIAVCVSVGMSVRLLFSCAGLVPFLHLLKVEPSAPMKRTHWKAVSTLFLFVCVSFVCRYLARTHVHTHTHTKAGAWEPWAYRTHTH